MFKPITSRAKALSEFKESSEKPLPFNNFSEFLKQGADPSLAESLQVFRWFSIRVGTSFSHNFYFDTKFGLILAFCKDGETSLTDSNQLACLGFEHNVTKTKIIIKQIQGPTFSCKNTGDGSMNHNRIRGWIKWERMMVKILCEWGAKNNFDTIEIQASKKNKWLSKSSSEQDKKRFYMRYDVTAKRMGFKLNKSKTAYIKKLKYAPTAT